MATTEVNLQTAPGHQVLAAAGKTILRPGGRAATEQLLQWANLQPGDTVLELAASFGYSAIALAQRYGVRVVGIEKNPESVARAQDNVAAARLTDQVRVIEGDIFQLNQIPEQFDCVLAEAILTMQSPTGKAKILAGVRDRLKPGGKFLSHELCASRNLDTIHCDLSRVIRVNALPLSQSKWINLCEEAGLTVRQSQTGKMGLLNPKQLVRDEGIPGTLKILWKMLTRPAIRDRILAMRQVFQQHQQDLGYIILWAVNEQ